LPQSNLGNDTAVCQGQSVTLDGGNQGDNHQWSTGETTQSITVNTSGIYWLIVTNSFGCKAIDSIGVTVNPPPFIFLGSDTTICTSSQLILDAGSGFAAYQWQDGSANETFTLDGSIGVGVYPVSVNVTDINGCINSDTITSNCRSLHRHHVAARINLFSLSQSCKECCHYSFPEMIREITLLDLTGKMIMHHEYNSEMNNISLSTKAFNEGIYMLQIAGDKSTQMIKLVIQN